MEYYAKRLHNPFQGVIQVIDTVSARALSYDGKQWELQYRCDMRQLKPALAQYQPRFQYARVGRWDTCDGFKPYPLDPTIDRNAVEDACIPILAGLGNLPVSPLSQDDHYELWLLDGDEHRPLALLGSCRHFGEMASVSRPAWKALNAAQLVISNTEEEIQRGLPPVHYRLENAVRNRAGQNPHAVWFQRQVNGSGKRVDETMGEVCLPQSVFPELLLREDWKDSQSQQLCQRYLQRLAPQLLMLQNLTRQTRARLEHLASPYAQEVDRYFHLYPEVADEQHMMALRVEARLREAVL